jgi:hypothetical protein
VSFWVFDDRGELGLPRVGIEALSSSWEAHAIQVNVAFPDGGVFRVRQDAPSWPAEGPDGRPTVLGAGPLGFTCIREFDTWRMTFDGQPMQTSSADLVAARTTGPLVDVHFDVEATLAVPPWIQGALDEKSATQLAKSVEGDLMGGPGTSSCSGQGERCASTATRPRSLLRRRGPDSCSRGRSAVVASAANR